MIGQCNISAYRRGDRNSELPLNLDPTCAPHTFQPSTDHILPFTHLQFYSLSPAPYSNMPLDKFDGLELPAAADMHVHLRDGAMMETVTPTIRQGGVNTVYVMV